MRQQHLHGAEHGEEALPNHKGEQHISAGRQRLQWPRNIIKEHAGWSVRRCLTRDLLSSDVEKRVLLNPATESVFQDYMLLVRTCEAGSDCGCRRWTSVVTCPAERVSRGWISFGTSHPAHTQHAFTDSRIFPDLLALFKTTMANMHTRPLLQSMSRAGAEQ